MGPLKVPAKMVLFFNPLFSNEWGMYNEIYEIP